MNPKENLAERILRARQLEELAEKLRSITPHHFSWQLPKRQNDECIIMASGPSVRDIQKDICSYAHKLDFITMNSFLDMSEFGDKDSVLHIVADPIFFNLKDLQNAQSQSIFRDLQNYKKPLLFAIPYKYYDVTMTYDFPPNIKVVGYPLDRYSEIPGNLRFPLADSGLVGFGGQTVPVVGIFLAIAAGYKKIWIAGFDADWFAKSYVDKHCNVRFVYKHLFYPQDGDVYEHNMYIHHRAHTKILDELNALREYADWHKTLIVNLSLGSHIDTFPKGILGQEPYPMYVHPLDPNFVE